VDGTWNVPTTLWTAHGMRLLLCGRHMECAYYFVDGTWNVPTTLTLVGCVSIVLWDNVGNFAAGPGT